MDDPAPLLRIGDRVVVAADYDWARNASGVIAATPAEIREHSDGWRDYWRAVPTRDGSNVFYWVIFDQPQLDEDGDGPYNAAEIPAAHLRPASRD